MEGNECTKAAALSCGDCIKVGQQCGWCTLKVSPSLGLLILNGGCGGGGSLNKTFSISLNFVQDL